MFECSLLHSNHQHVSATHVAIYSVFLIQNTAKRVDSAVRTGPLNEAVCARSFKG
jgi:hypothetical protein